MYKHEVAQIYSFKSDLKKPFVILTLFNTSAESMYRFCVAFSLKEKRQICAALFKLGVGLPLGRKNVNHSLN